MKILKTTVLLFSLAIVGAGCSDVAAPQAATQQPTPVVALAPTPYTHSVYGFSIQPPQKWTTDEKNENFPLIIKADHADVASDNVNYRANINFQVTKLTNGSVPETAKKFLTTFGNDWKAMRVVEEGTTKISGNEAYRIVLDLEGEGFSPRGECVVVRADAIDGLVACGYALQTKWSDYKGTIEASLATIKP